MSNTQRQSWIDVRDQIHGRILDSTYRPGDRLPRDEDLAGEFGCARTTIHRAMRSLADNGIVERRRKAGTTVRSDPVTRTTLDIPITRLEVEGRGDTYGYHLISREIRQPTSLIAARFGLAGQQELLNACSLHLSNGRPYIFENRWISLQTVPEILDVDLSEESANEWLVRNRPYNRCDVQIYAHALAETDAARMDIPTGSAVLVLERTTWINGNPITHVRTLTSPGYRLATSG